MGADPGTDRDHPSVATPRVARNAMYLALADIANKVMVFVFFTTAARNLGAAGFGTFSLALAVATMVSVIADLGLGFLTARSVARDVRVAAWHFANSMTIKMVLACVLVGGVAVFARAAGYPPSQASVMIVTGIFIVPNVALIYQSALFQGFERMEFTALSRLIQTGLLVVGGWLIRGGAATALRYAWLYVAAAAAASIASMAFALRLLPSRWPRVHPSMWPGMLRSALPFGVSSLLVVFYYWNGTALLSRFSGETQVGFYSAAFRLVLGVGFLSFAFSGAMYPVMSRLHVSGSERLSRSVTTSLRYVALLAVPISLLGSVLSRPVTTLVYGAAYLPSARMLLVLSWWGGLASVNSMLSNYLYAADKPKPVVLQATVALIINVCLNLVLVSRAGGMGVAVSITVAEFVSTAILIVAQQRTAARFDVRRLAPSLARYTIGALVSAPPAWLAATRLHPVAGIAIGLVLYSVSLLLTREVGRSELQMLKRLVRP